MKRSQWAVVVFVISVSLILAVSPLFGINIPLLLGQWFPIPLDPWALLVFSWVFFFAILAFLEKATSLFIWLAKALSGISFYFEKKAVRLRIESIIGPAAKEVNDEGVELLPHGIKINWVEPRNRDTFLKDGKVVVCLESSRNEDKNLARATAHFVSHDLIRDSQRFVDPTIMESAILALVRKMLMMDKRIDALRFLGQEFINPAVGKNPKIGMYIPAMELLDTQGHFTRVLLREFSYLGARLGPRASDLRTVADTRAFTNFLKVFEEREPEGKVPLDYYGKIIRASLLIVARPDPGFSTSIYQRRVVKAHRKEIDTIYVLARGYNEVLAELVVKRAVESGLYQEQQKWSFKVTLNGRRVKSYVAVLARTNP